MQEHRQEKLVFASKSLIFTRKLGGTIYILTRNNLLCSAGKKSHKSIYRTLLCTPQSIAFAPFGMQS